MNGSKKGMELGSYDPRLCSSVELPRPAGWEAARRLRSTQLGRRETPAATGAWGQGQILGDCRKVGAGLGNPGGLTLRGCITGLGPGSWVS